MVCMCLGDGSKRHVQRLLLGAVLWVKLPLERTGHLSGIFIYLFVQSVG